MDKTCAVTLVLCGLGLAVDGWASVRTPRPAVMLTDATGANHKGDIDPAVTFFVTRTAAAAR